MIKPLAVIVVVALLAAVATMFLVKLWLDRQPSAPAAAATVEVLVVARAVPAGTPLQNDDLRYDRWPASVASPRLTLRQGSQDGRSAWVGQIARRALSEGEPFTAEATAHRENVGLMAGMVTPGLRAVSIAISNPSAVSGFVTPGDFVDVLVAADLARALESNHAAASDTLLRFAAETVLHGVRVLAIDQQFSRSNDGGAVQGKTATLEVSAKQAEILTVAGQLGPLQLVLRGKDTDGTPPPRGFSGDVEISAALRMALASRAEVSGTGGLRVQGPRISINRGGAVSVEELAR